MKGEDSIKEEGGSERGRSRNQERDTVAIKNEICSQTCKKYIRTDLFGLCQGRFNLN